MIVVNSQEKLMGRTFNISPQAFFQVNTLGAELLYKTVGDDAKMDELYCIQN